MQTRLLALPVLASLAACLDLHLDGKSTVMTATTDASGVTSVRICPGQALLACSGSGNYLVSAGGELKSTAGAAPYTVSFTAAEPGSLLTIVRDDGATARVTLPEPFTLTATGNILTWTPSGGDDRMEIMTTRECGSQFTSDAGQEIDDSGRYEVEQKLGCQTTVTLTRERDGDVGNFTDGSTLIAVEERSASF